MTTPTPTPASGTSPSASGRTTVRWAEVAGFAVIAANALLPLNGAQAWLVLTVWRRWAWTDPLFALVVLGVAVLMLVRGARVRVPLYLVVAVALVVIVGTGYDVWFAYARPQEDDYLPAETFLGGNFFIVVFAACGAFGTLTSWRPRW